MNSLFNSKTTRLLFFAIFFFCIHKSTSYCELAKVDFSNAFGNVSSKPVLIIGKVSISQYTIEKNLRDHLISISPKERSLLSENQSILNQWLTDFIDTRFLAAEGYNLGLDANNSIKKGVSAMDRYILTDPNSDGYDLILKELARKKGQKTDNINWPNIKEQISTAHIQNRRSNLKITYNQDSISAFHQRLPKREPQDLIIQSSWISGIEDSALAYYEKEGISLELTVREFSDRFNRAIIRTYPNQSSGIFFQIEKWLIQDLDYEFALKMGLDQNSKLSQDRQNHIHRRMIKLIDSEIIRPDIMVSESEITEFYEKNRESYVGEKEAVVLINRFTTSTEAYGSYAANIGIRNTNPITINRSNESFPSIIKRTAFALRAGERSHPLFCESDFAIITKIEGRGIYTIPINAVKFEIIEIITNKKITKLRNTLVERAKKHHRIVNNINYLSIFNKAKTLID